MPVGNNINRHFFNLKTEAVLKTSDIILSKNDLNFLFIYISGKKIKK